MPDKCFIPFCRTGYKPRKGESEISVRLTLFGVPKDQQQFAAWERAVPRQGLNSKSKICEKHFCHHEIISHFPTVNGFSLQWEVKKLIDGSIPSQFPGKEIN